MLRNTPILRGIVMITEYKCLDTQHVDIYCLGKRHYFGRSGLVESDIRRRY